MTRARSIAFSLLCIVFLASIAAGARAELTPLDADTMNARVLITNTLNLQSTGPGYRVSDATGTLSWFPRENWLQQVDSITIDPPATSRTDDTITFHWDGPQPSESISVFSTVTTRNAIVPVRDRIPFPIASVPPEIAPYLAPGEITDETPEIQRLAQQLAAGKTDTYEVVYTLADWTTTNVQYSLASLGQPASKKSSEVLATKQGKCDELTSLFISMNRALGIPARFVAGYSYTNSKQFSKSWGGHGWAEVWLPGQGWVPFDVTYGEYGYLDAGHVTLKVAADAKETSIDYTAKGNDFELQTAPLDITVTPTQMSARQSDDITVTLDTPHPTVGFGSAVLILATIKNNRDYYVSTRLDLAKTTNTDLLSSTYENVLLRPHEAKVVPFLIQIDSDLQSGYKYDFPFKLYTRLGAEGTISIAVAENAPFYDQSAYAEEINRYTQSTDAPSSFTITCDQGSVAYVGNGITHNCMVRGSSAVAVQVCESTSGQVRSCSTESVKAGQFTLETKDSKPGVYTRTYTAKADGTTQFFVTSRSVTQTNVSIAITAPDIVTADQLFTVNATVKETGALAKNVTVRAIAHNSDTQEHFDDLSKPTIVNFVVPGRALRPGDNAFIVAANWTDELGAPGSAKETVHIQLTNVSLLDQIQFWLEDAGTWIGSIFS